MRLPPYGNKNTGRKKENLPWFSVASIVRHAADDKLDAVKLRVEQCFQSLARQQRRPRCRGRGRRIAQCDDAGIVHAVLAQDDVKLVKAGFGIVKSSNSKKHIGCAIPGGGVQARPHIALPDIGIIDARHIAVDLCAGFRIGIGQFQLQGVAGLELDGVAKAVGDIEIGDAVGRIHQHGRGIHAHGFDDDRGRGG